jgi:hypothetical protein
VRRKEKFTIGMQIRRSFGAVILETMGNRVRNRGDIKMGRMEVFR